MKPDRSSGVNHLESGAPIRIGISSCLLGNEVRYDGGHKREPLLADALLSDELGAQIEWVAVCPEVEVGMGVPRPRLQLQDDAGQLRMLESESGRDHTASMQRFAQQRVSELRSLDLRGYVLKRGSPSCGMQGVAVHDERGEPRPRGRGLFAEALMQALPWLPVEEEGRLRDPLLRGDFLERVRACHSRYLLGHV